MAVDTPHLQPGEYSALPNPFTTPFDALKHIPLATLHQPVRIKVAGIDNATLDTVPRLEQEGLAFTHLFVEAFVYVMCPCALACLFCLFVVVVAVVVAVLMFAGEFAGVCW